MRLKGRMLRSQSASSMVEMLICTTIISLVAAGSMATLVAQNQVAQRFGNKMDAINAERIAIERIGRDIREARSLGDVYGTMKSFPTGGNPPTVNIIEGASWFPSNRDPLYGGGASPPKGWPDSTGWSADGGIPAPGRYSLSNTCLIAQVPIFDAQGFPTMIPKDTFGPGQPATAQANVETHIYRIVPRDQDVFPGEMQLEYCVIPGMTVPGYDADNRQMGPQVIMTGIIGPRDAAGNLRVFQYIDRTSNGVAENTISDPARVANYTGVIVNLEVLKHTNGAISSANSSRFKTTKHDSIIGFKTEVFLRNNALATETAAQ